MTMMTVDSVIGGTCLELRNNFEIFQFIYIIYKLTETELRTDVMVAEMTTVNCHHCHHKKSIG